MSDDISNQQNPWIHTTLSEFSGQRGQSIEPSKTPDSQFELYSIPSYPTGQPEIVSGKQVGSNKQVVTSECVLLSKINPRINRVWVVGHFSRHTKIASTEWIVFPPDKRVEPKFLCYFLQQNVVRDFLASNVSGVGGSLMRVKPSTLRDFPFAYPGRDEQSSIVKEIEKQFSRLDEAVANLKRVKANLKRYKAAVLKAAVEGKLTEDWRKQHPDVEPASKFLERILAQGPDRSSDRTKHKRDVEGDSGALFQLPKSWTWCKAHRLAEIIDPQPSHRTPEEISGGVPYIGMGDVREQGTIDFVNARKVSREILEGHRQRYQLRKGNFIFGKIGTLGAPVLLPEPFEYTLSANVVLFQPDSKITNPGFVLAYMRSPIVGSYLIKMSKATSQPAFGIQKVREMPVPLPPLEEQNEIVAEVERRLSVIEELEAAVEANLTRADRLRQTILKSAFSGDLVGRNKGVANSDHQLMPTTQQR